MVNGYEYFAGTVRKIPIENISIFTHYVYLVLGETSVKWLGEQACEKYKDLNKPEINNELKYVLKIRTAKEGVMLDNDNIIKNILDKNDSVVFGTILSPFVIRHFKFIQELFSFSCR